MKKILFILVIAALLLPGLSLSCVARNPVVDYTKSLNLPPVLLQELEPLGKDGIMDEVEKALIDELYFLPQEVQTSQTTLNLLREIVQDAVITGEELARFGDLDQDGLSNQEELEQGTNLFNSDTDQDGLRDGDEFLTYRTNPLEADTDGDGLGDKAEVLTYQTDPSNPDSDGDGLGDGEEILTYKTNPFIQDTDNDGLSDKEEALNYQTNPLEKDTDGDSLTDLREIQVYQSDPLDKDDPLNKDSDGDGVIDCDDLEPLKENSYKETVGWLSREMKWDALLCIVEDDKVQTFENLQQKVRENVPHAGMGGLSAYPNAKLDAFSHNKHPRDILMDYYSYHQKVQLPPVCDDIACVYDIMADYIIAETGWDEEGEKQGNNGVDCDVFPVYLFPAELGGYHLVCIVNINGAEYVADSSYAGRFFPLGQNSRYAFPWEGGVNWWPSYKTDILLAKFDKRFTVSIYNSYTRNRRADFSWDLFRNQTPENEEKLEALYLKIAYLGD